jgi:hypothetical protein
MSTPLLSNQPLINCFCLNPTEITWSQCLSTTTVKPAAGLLSRDPLTLDYVWTVLCSRSNANSCSARREMHDSHWLKAHWQNGKTFLEVVNLFLQYALRNKHFLYQRSSFIMLSFPATRAANTGTRTRDIFSRILSCVLLLVLRDKYAKFGASRCAHSRAGCDNTRTLTWTTLIFIPGGLFRVCNRFP